LFKEVRHIPPKPLTLDLFFRRDCYYL
jgi:hypothetical protein